MIEVVVGFVSFIALVVAWAFVPTRPETEAAENVRTAAAMS